MQATNLSKEDLRALIQAFREWELRTPRSEVVWVEFGTDPQLSTEEARDLFQGIYPPFKEQITIPSRTRQLNLGHRAISVTGEGIVGTVDELSLTLADASDEQIQRLQDAQTISLVKMGKG